jgi:hypothetical protein
MRLLARLYYWLPVWAVHLLPDKVNHAETGRFHDLVADVYDERVERAYRKLERRKS